jgi:hypothetical protein
MSTYCNLNAYGYTDYLTKQKEINFQLCEISGPLGGEYEV